MKLPDSLADFLVLGVVLVVIAVGFLVFSNIFPSCKQEEDPVPIVNLYQSQLDSADALVRRISSQRETAERRATELTQELLKLGAESSTLRRRLGTQTPKTELDSTYYLLWQNAEESFQKSQQQVAYLREEIYSLELIVQLQKNSIAVATLTIETLSEQLSSKTHFWKGLYARGSVGTRYTLDRLYADFGLGFTLRGGGVEIDIEPFWIQTNGSLGPRVAGRVYF